MGVCLLLACIESADAASCCRAGPAPAHLRPRCRVCNAGRVRKGADLLLCCLHTGLLHDIVPARRQALVGVPHDGEDSAQLGLGAVGEAHVVTCGRGMEGSSDNQQCVGGSGGGAAWRSAGGHNSAQAQLGASPATSR